MPDYYRRFIDPIDIVCLKTCPMDGHRLGERFALVLQICHVLAPLRVDGDTGQLREARMALWKAKARGLGAFLDDVTAREPGREAVAHAPHDRVTARLTRAELRAGSRLAAKKLGLRIVKYAELLGLEGYAAPGSIVSVARPTTFPDANSYVSDIGRPTVP